MKNFPSASIFQRNHFKNFFDIIFFYREISCKKFKNHLQFYVKILLKKKSSFFPGKSLYFFFQNHTFSNIFQKASPRGCFWKFLKRVEKGKKGKTHKKIVVQVFIYMVVLPLISNLIDVFIIKREEEKRVKRREVYVFCVQHKTKNTYNT